MISVEEARQNVRDHEVAMSNHTAKMVNKWLEEVASSIIRTASREGRNSVIILCESTYIEPIIETLRDKGYAVDRGGFHLNIRWDDNK